MAMENGPVISDCPIKPSIYEGCSIAMFDYQRVEVSAKKGGYNLSMAFWTVHLFQRHSL